MDSCLRANTWTVDLKALVVMPDHVHMVFTPLVDPERAEVFSLARITKAIKNTSAHLINRRLGSPGRVWQEARDRPVRAAVDVLAGPPGPAQVWQDTGTGPLAGGAGAYLLW